MKTEQALVKLGDLLKQAMVQKLNSTTNGTGALARSISFKVEEPEKGTYRLVRTMDEYGNYIDSGVKGTSNKKGIPNPQSLFEIGQFRHTAIAPESGLDYPVRYVIARDGIAPKPFIVPSIEQVLQTAGKELIVAASMEDLQEMFNNNTKQNIKVTA